MNQETEILLLLDDEIERKCFEIKQKNTEKKLQRFFITACILFLIIPIFLTFAKVNILTYLLPASIFIIVPISILTSLLVNNKGDYIL